MCTGAGAKDRSALRVHPLPGSRARLAARSSRSPHSVGTAGPKELIEASTRKATAMPEPVLRFTTETHAPLSSARGGASPLCAGGGRGGAQSLFHRQQPDPPLPHASQDFETAGLRAREEVPREEGFTESRIQEDDDVGAGRARVSAFLLTPHGRSVPSSGRTRGSHQTSPGGHRPGHPNRRHGHGPLPPWPGDAPSTWPGCSRRRGTAREPLLHGTCGAAPDRPSSNA